MSWTFNARTLPPGVTRKRLADGGFKIMINEGYLASLRKRLEEGRDVEDDVIVKLILFSLEHRQADCLKALLNVGVHTEVRYYLKTLVWAVYQNMAKVVKLVFEAISQLQCDVEVDVRRKMMDEISSNFFWTLGGVNKVRSGVRFSDEREGIQEALGSTYWKYQDGVITLLEFAAFQGFDKCVEALLPHETRVHVIATALSKAIFMNHIQCARMLIRKIDLGRNLKIDKHWCGGHNDACYIPIMYAIARFSHTKGLEMLLDLGAPVKLSFEGFTLPAYLVNVMDPCKYHYLHRLKLLLKFGCDPDECFYLGHRYVSFFEKENNLLNWMRIIVAAGASSANLQTRLRVCSNICPTIEARQFVTKASAHIPNLFLLCRAVIRRHIHPEIGRSVPKKINMLTVPTHVKTMLNLDELEEIRVPIDV